MPAEKSRYSLPAPLLLPAINTAVGIILGKYLPFPWQAAIWLVFTLLLLALIFKKLRPWLILSLFIGVGFFRWQVYDSQANRLSAILAKKGSVRQEIIFQLKGRVNEDSYEIELEEIGGVKWHAPLIFRESEELTSGMRYRAVAELSPLLPDPVLNLYATQYQASVRSLVPAKPLPESTKVPVSAQIAQFVKGRLQPLISEDRDLASALLLGDPVFKKTQQDLLSRTGISHLVVVSGLHVLFIYLISITILRFFFPHRLADAAFLLLILVFAAVNQWAAPILRAILMIGVGIIAKWISRPVSSAQLLSISFLIIVLARPLELFSPGFQLSFGSVAIIIFALPKIPGQDDGKCLKRSSMQILQYILLSFVVTLGLLPFTLYYFGSLSFNSIIANLLGLPIIYLLLGLAMAILLLPFKPMYLAFSFISEIWGKWLKLCALPPFHLQGHWLPASCCLAIAGVFVLAAILIKRKWQLLKIVGIPLTALILALLFFPLPQKNKLYLFDAKMAECSLIFADNGESLMIDSGGLLGMMPGETVESLDEIYEKSWLKQRLLPWLGHSGIRNLDYLLITHLHNDHDSGIYPLLKHLRVKNLILSKSSFESEHWQNLAPQLPLDKTRIICIQDTGSIYLGQNRLKILHPDAEFEISDENNRSLVCRLDTAAKSYLFTGDIEAKAENYLLQKYAEELKADFLKVAHHGSRTSSNRDFLQAVNAHQAFISCSYKNVHSFPHAEALGRLYHGVSEIFFSYNGTKCLPLD